MVPENNQALFTPRGLAGLSLSGPKAVAAWGAGSPCGGEGSRERSVTAGPTMWALFPPCITSGPLRVEGREELRWEPLPGLGELPIQKKGEASCGGPPVSQPAQG